MTKQVGHAWNGQMSQGASPYRSGPDEPRELDSHSRESLCQAAIRGNQDRAQFLGERDKFAIVG